MYLTFLICFKGTIPRCEPGGYSFFSITSALKFSKSVIVKVTSELFGISHSRSRLTLES